MKKLAVGIFLPLLLISNTSAKNSSSVNVEVLTKTTQSWDGDDLPSYGAGKPEISLLKFVIAPNTKLPLHKHPVINAGVLLSGNLKVVSEDGAILNMQAGDTIVELVNKWHYGINEGTEPVEILVFYAGIQGEPITIKK